MKIKDIVMREDNGQPFGKIANVDQANKKVTFEKPDGTKTDVPSSAVMPDPDHPGQVSVDSTATQGELKPGMTGTTASETSEDASGSDPQTAQLTQLMNQAREPWLKKFYAYRINYLNDQKALAGEPGAGMGAPLDAKGNLKPVEPDPMKWIQQNPSIVKDMPFDALPPGMKQPGMVDKIKGAFGMEETHHDTVASGNHDVGGDATDNFINQVRDKGFERANRNSPAQGTRSPLPESDELMKWLTIAGLK